MVYKKFTINTTPEAVDFISAALSDIGVEGIEIDDGITLSEEERKAMFIDIMPDETPGDGSAKVSFYLDADMDESKMGAMLLDVENALDEVATYVDAGSLEISASDTADEDWLNNWKEFFHPFSVGDVLIKPTWEGAEIGDHKLMLSIDPGTAFGTGSHETTKLCINGIRKHLKKGDKILDVGCGSGILSIVALLSGASYAFGTDLDPQAIIASRDNARVNKIPDENFDIIEGNIIDDEEVKAKTGGGYDMVVANILAPVIIMLESVIINHIKDGGTFIVSGIIDFKEAEVKEAFALNPMWEYIETAHDGEWVSIVYRKRTT